MIEIYLGTHAISHILGPSSPPLLCVAAGCFSPDFFCDVSRYNVRAVLQRLSKQKAHKGSNNERCPNKEPKNILNPSL